MTEAIVATFAERAAAEGDTIIETILAAATKNTLEEQDSRLQTRTKRRRRL
jgi:hypothetical protein